MDSPVQASAVPARSLAVRVRNVGGTLVLAGFGDSPAVELSETAAVVWRAMDGRRTVAELGELLSETYAVEVGTATEDVAEMVADLAAKGLATIDGGPAGREH